MITLLIVLGMVAGWLVVSRQLFRYLVRAELLTVNAECTHGYSMIHNREPCARRVLWAKWQMAGGAMLAVLFFPVTLAFLAVMHKAPLSQRELSDQIARLEEENQKLRLEQE